MPLPPDVIQRHLTQTFETATRAAGDTIQPLVALLAVALDQLEREVVAAREDGARRARLDLEVARRHVESALRAVRPLA